ncbi:M48 family metallopeptidase [Spirosoma areae]
MKNALIAMLAISVVIGCQKVPLTGRSQLVLIPNESLLPLSFTNYREVLGTSQVVRSNTDAEMVQRVGNNLRQAMEQYLRANNFGNRLDGYQWEFNLIESPQVNAWCMPGGKVAFYTGILPYTQNEAGAAAVMGHEISHAIAEHGRERMSEGLISSGLVQVGQSYLNSKAQQNPKATNTIFMQAVGAALPAGVAVARTLPHSRAQESEADKLGLIFMAMAGYNPQEAISFWGRMAKAGGGKKTAEFLSTHPSDERRIRDLQAQLPEAMKYYKR